MGKIIVENRSRSISFYLVQSRSKTVLKTAFSFNNRSISFNFRSTSF